jgi:hypothetical protein
VPVDEGAFHHRNREKLAFAGASALLVAYAASWVLAEAPSSAGAAGGSTVQRLAVGEEARAPLPDADAVFAAAGEAEYYDTSIPPRWVMPKVEKVTIAPVRLDPPVPVYPPPPMLLPVPGPAPAHTSELPRWPDFPGPAGGD